MPYLQVLSEFREGVRRIAREKKGEASGLESCGVTLASLPLSIPKWPRPSLQPRWALGAVGFLGQLCRQRGVLPGLLGDCGTGPELVWPGSLGLSLWDLAAPFGRQDRARARGASSF